MTIPSSLNRPGNTGLGTPGAPAATRVMLLGSGELGKEVAIELQRFGVEVIALDRYANAPAMQVAHRSYVIDMRDPQALREVIETESPHLVVPEIEAIATEALVALEGEGVSVVPTASAAALTMNREGIRLLAAEELGVATSPFRFASSRNEFNVAVQEIGLPCVVKPIMSSSGKGQSTIKIEDDIETAWNYAREGARGDSGRVIVEGYVEFDYEITLLTVRHKDGISFCDPIGHRQVGGDYRESWQPQAMTASVLSECERIASLVTQALGGYGLFGVEFFIQSDVVYFSEVSPRPHDTGLVTLVSQDLSEFALHARAILGLPIPGIRTYGAAASAVVLASGSSTDLRYTGVDAALAEPDTQVRLFGKPDVDGERRVGVVLALGADTEEARKKATAAAAKIDIHLS